MSDGWRCGCGWRKRKWFFFPNEVTGEFDWFKKFQTHIQIRTHTHLYIWAVACYSIWSFVPRNHRMHLSDRSVDSIVLCQVLMNFFLLTVLCFVYTSLSFDAIVAVVKKKYWAKRHTNTIWKNKRMLEKYFTAVQMVTISTFGKLSIVNSIRVHVWEISFLSVFTCNLSISVYECVKYVCAWICMNSTWLMIQACQLVYSWSS